MTVTATRAAPLWSVVRSTHSTFDCEACDGVAQAAAGRLATGAVRVTLTEDRPDGKHRVTVEQCKRELTAMSTSTPPRSAA